MKLRIILTTTSLVVALGLSACSGDTDATGCGGFESGAASASVKVSGEFGDSTSILIGTIVDVDSLQRTILIAGKNKTPAEGSSVNAVVSVFNGTSGDRINQLEGTFTVGDPNLAKPTRAGIDCLALGSRTVSTFPASELYSEDALTAVGLQADQPLVQVVDLVELTSPTK